MVEKCDCCNLEINYDVKNGRAVNVVVLPLEFKSVLINKAIFQCEAEILPKDCRDCGENCKARQIIAKCTSKK